MNAHEDDKRITREAANWYMELQTAGPTGHEEFAQWLRRSPEHVQEFLAITGVSKTLDGVDPLRKIDVQALMADEGTNVVALAHPALAAAGKRKGRKIMWLAAACVAAGVAIAWQWQLTKPEIYATRIGEQRAIKLPDGSLIHLNTQSRAQVNFSAAAREVRLLAGEVLFTVERDPNRPFRVLSGGTTVQVIGTQFNVYRSPSGDIKVSVVEGAVQVTEDTAPQKPTRLEAGEQADVRGRVIAKHSVPDVQSVTAWRHRQLVFRNKPLAEVVAEFNRYNTVQFEVEPAAGGELLSGVFAADRPESFVLFLEKDKSVEVIRQNGRLVIRPR